jgi:hypothetical protein
VPRVDSGDELLDVGVGDLHRPALIGARGKELAEAADGPSITAMAEACVAAAPR